MFQKLSEQSIKIVSGLNRSVLSSSFISPYNPLMQSFQRYYTNTKLLINPNDEVDQFLLTIRDSVTTSKYINDLFIEYRHKEVKDIYHKLKPFDVKLNETATRELIHLFCKEDKLNEVLFLYNQYRQYNHEYLSDEICNEIIMYYCIKNDENKLNNYYNSIKKYFIPKSEKSYIHYHHKHKNFQILKKLVEDKMNSNKETLCIESLEEYLLFCLECKEYNEVIKVFEYHKDRNIINEKTFSYYIGSLYEIREYDKIINEVKEIIDNIENNNNIESQNLQNNESNNSQQSIETFNLYYNLIGSHLIYKILLCENRHSPAVDSKGLLLKCCNIVEKRKCKYVSDDRAVYTLLICYFENGLVDKYMKLIDKVLPQLNNKRVYTVIEIIRISIENNILWNLIKKFEYYGYKFNVKVYEIVISKLLRENKKEIAVELLSYLNNHGYNMSNQLSNYYKSKY